MTDASLIIPGLIHVGADESGKGTGAPAQIGVAVGWTMPRGVHTWSRELSVVIKEEITPALQRELGVVLPEEQGDPEVVPRARHAAQACNVVAVDGEIVDQVLAKGLRVHTVGVDRVSNGFFYISKGGSAPAKRVQGGLIEMVSSMDQPASNAELEARLDGLIDRLIGQLSDGILSEPQLELAEALPALGPKSSDAGAKLQTLEGWLILATSRSKQFEADARQLVDTLRSATRNGKEVVPVPLFGEARRVVQPDIEVEFTEGDAGKLTRVTLPARSRWFVTGRFTPSMQPAAPKPVAAAAEPRTAAPEPARQPAARPAEVASPPATTAASAAAQQAAAQRVAAERAAAEQRAAAERAAAQRAATEQRAAAERAAAQRAAAERAAGERAAAEQRAIAERAAAERAASERVAADRAAADRAAAERAAAERAAAERASAEKQASERTAAERAVAPRAAAEAKPSTRPSQAAPRAAVAKPQPKAVSVGFILLMLVLGGLLGVLVRVLLGR